MSFLLNKRSFLTRAGLILLLFAIQDFAFSQQPNHCDYERPHEADKWTFGKNALLDFEQDSPESMLMGAGNIELPYGCASISDENGNLLFFTDGKSLYSGGYYLLNNINDLGGSVASSQSAIFVPTPGNKDKYYVFTVDMYIYPIFVEGIKYSTIEKVDGNWQLTSKNKFLYTPNTQKITAVKQKNQNDFWIIIHGYGESEGKKFLVYELNESGLDTITKQELEIGNIHNGTYDETSRNNGGYMKVSSDGSKIALAIPYDGIVEVFNFDNETGMISEFKSSLPNAFNMPYGIEFSPDNKLLYFSTAPTETNTFSQIYQLNLEDADCFTNYEIIADLTDDDTRYFGALQLGVDGKIYVANYLRGNNKANNLNIINNPNRIGNDCNFGLDGLPLTSNSGSFTGLPNFVTSFLDIPHFSWINQCATQITYFNLRNETNVGTPEWKYGSASETGSGVQGSYTFSQPGNYTVSVTENYNGISYPSYERNITIHPLPPVELGGPVLYILPGSSVTLDAGEFDEYLWEPDGSTERYIDVSEEGVYKVTVTDTNCCVNEDQIEIKLAKIYFPTAFKPTSSVIQNATFKCLGDITAMLNFNMKIFNRWGQMVFSSDDPDKGWDGTFSGGDAEVGVYVWVINYSSTESRYQTAQSSSQRGTVTLLR